MNREPVNSSNIASVGYDRGILEIEFKNGSLYHYHQVPEEVFENWFKTESVGSYFFKHIKNVFPFNLVDPRKEIEDEI